MPEPDASRSHQDHGPCFGAHAGLKNQVSEGALGFSVVVSRAGFLLSTMREIFRTSRILGLHKKRRPDSRAGAVLARNFGAATKNNGIFGGTFFSRKGRIVYSCGF